MPIAIQSSPKVRPLPPTQAGEPLDSKVSTRPVPRDILDEPRAADPMHLLDAEASRPPAPPIQIGGRELPRLSRPPTASTGPAKAAMHFCLRTVVSHSALLMKEVRDQTPDEVPPWRRPEAAREAMLDPLPKLPAGSPPKLGGLTVIRNGFGNISPSAAEVFRAARMSDKVVVAFTNSTNGPQALRELKEYEGVPVPKELKGKLFAIGSPDECVISYLQSSDLFLEQLEQLHQQRAKLGVDVLTSKMTVIGHSQGGLDAALTRKRLEEAGFPDAIGTLVAIASPFKGAPFPNRLTGLLGASATHVLDNDDGFKAVKQLDPEWTRPWFDAATERRVDFSFSGAIGGKAKLRPSLKPPFFAVEDPNNIRPVLRLLATVTDATDLMTLPIWEVMRRLRRASPDDGMVPVDSAAYGKHQIRFEHPYDHMSIWEDFRVIDQIAVRVEQARDEKSAGRRSA